ncbi:hypothetical protein D3C72_1743700 [compost metagenome]
MAAIEDQVEQRCGGRSIKPAEGLHQQQGGLRGQRQTARAGRDRPAQQMHAGKERQHSEGRVLGASHGRRDGRPATGGQEGVLGGEEGGQLVESVEPARSQQHPLDRQDPVAAAMLVQHLFTGQQRLDGALAAVGHDDAGTGREAGLGIGLIRLPLVVAEVIAVRGGKQGQSDGRSHQQSALAGFEGGQ